MKKLLTIFFALALTTSVWGQTAQSVDLNWKIAPDEKLTYKTVMNQVDTSSMQFDFDNFLGIFSDSTIEKDIKAQNMLKAISKAFQEKSLLTTLSNNRQGIIEIVSSMQSDEKIEDMKFDSTASAEDQMAKMLLALQDVMLRGSVYESGGIHSFWVKSNQKNIISMFFELPEKPVKVGDRWKLEVNLISNDQNFECDSAYKINQVQLTELKRINGERIAVLKYEITEYVDGVFHSPAAFSKGGSIPTTMKLTYFAIAEFSIDKGRWHSYEGIMSYKTKGFMNTNSTQSFSLIEE